MSNNNSVKTAKTPKSKTAPAKKKIRKSTLTDAERSEIYRIAAYKAHQHKTFLKIQSSAAKKEDVSLREHRQEMIANRPAKYRKMFKA